MRWAEPLPVVPRRQLRVGQRVFAVGSPIGLRHSFTSGVISALRGDHIQTDATVHQGSSGGPLIDDSGGVCGIVTQTHSAKDFTFAIYADTVLELLEERRAATPAN
jgi:S1-C subfamily serine protease